MIVAVHSLIYADDADAARDFFRDVLGFPYVDTGGGWLIFRSGPSEIAAHPSGHAEAGAGGTHHELTLICDNIESTISELSAKGAEFTRDVRDDGWGLTTSVRVPGAGEVMIYQPKHALAYDL